SCPNIMRTLTEHIAMQIGTCLYKKGRILVTGGGAYNDFLISRIRHYSSAEIVVPDKETVNFKEALIFAFLGVLRFNNMVNCLSSITGARRDSCCGVIALP
ncbi:MAG: anhydro-N-acetylmuramic acid kinase, partial [Bacteroidales bacterium]|nr:anhydro-N-acetylmuramic acid kinase [Bacteroidales bacterium]